MPAGNGITPTAPNNITGPVKRGRYISNYKGAEQPMDSLLLSS
jgi:hypothetical protein